MIYKNMITVRVGTQRAAIIRDKIHEQIICEIRFIVSFLSGGSRIYKKIEVIKVQNKAKIKDCLFFAIVIVLDKKGILILIVMVAFGYVGRTDNNLKFPKCSLSTPMTNLRLQISNNNSEAFPQMFKQVEFLLLKLRTLTHLHRLVHASF